jgi:biotin carboxylase
VKTLLVVKSGWPLGFRLPAYRAFWARGWRVAVVDQVMNQSLRFADIPIVGNVADSTALAEMVLQRVGRPDGILTFNDSALVCAAHLAAQFGLPFISPPVAARAVSKSEQRRILAAAGLRVPAWRPVQTAREAAAAVAEWGSAVIKPVDRAAGAGVRLVHTPDEAETAFTEAQRESWTSQVLAEAYLDGPEVSVETVVLAGQHRVVTITDKLTTHGPHFIELGHSVPSQLRREEFNRVCETAVAACHAMGLTYGACHTEVKLTPQGPVVVEINPRLAGDCIVDLIDLALGINLYDIVGRLAMGDAVLPEDLMPRVQRGAAIRFYLSPGGVLNKVVCHLPPVAPQWLVELSVTVEAGMILPQPISNAGRIAYAVAIGETGSEAAQRATRAIQSLSIAVE